MVKVIQQHQNSNFNFVLLGQWNYWGKFEKGKLVETKEINPTDYEQYKSDKSWKPLGKAPFEKDWQNKNYAYNSKEVLKHDNNLGIIGGKGNLRMLDIDNEKLGESFEPIMDTLTIKTGSGGRHFYFLSDYSENKVLINGLGEIRANDYQVVCPPSRHPNGNPYVIYIDKPIRNIPKEEFLEIIKSYLKESQPATQSNINNFEQNQDKPKDESRSGFEMRELIKMILKGYSKTTIDKRMNFYSKWASSPEGYRKLTLEKAFARVKEIYEDKEEVKEEEVELEIFSDKDLMGYEPKKQKWLIENQIPDNEIGLLVGKRGERKTFTALEQVLCLASGKDCFGDKVPEPKRVIFVTEEDSVDSLVSRIKPLKKGLGIIEELPIKYLSFNGLKLDKDGVKFKKFKELILDFKPDLVVIDALQRCVGFEVDKDNRAISELFTEKIRPLQRETKCSWLFISHLRKTQANAKIIDELDEVRGGSELTNYCRFVLMAQAPRYQTKTEVGSDLIIFKVLKMSNSSLPEPKVISFTTEGDSIKVSYEGIPSEVLAGEVQCAKAIEEWLFNNQIEEFKTKEISDASEEIGFKKTLISYGLKFLIKKGIIKKVQRGLYQVTSTKKEEQEQKKITDKLKKKEKEKSEDDKIKEAMEELEE